MTVCIAANAHDGGSPRLVLCHDWLMGDDFSTWENMNKCDLGFSDNLSAMFSGRVDDIKHLRRLYRERFKQTTITAEVIEEELWAGMEQFKDALKRKGRDWTDVQVIVTGFMDHEPVIVHLDSEKVRSLPNLCVIGIGDYYAEPILRWRKIGHESSLDEVLYAVFEAKRLSERGRDVGKMTTMYVLEPKPDLTVEAHLVSKDGLALLEKQFAEYGPKPTKKIRFSKDGFFVY